MDTEYGPLMIEENGKNYLDFEINVIKQKLGKGLDGMSQIEDIGSWNVGTPGTLELKPGASQALKQFSSKTIYRIVTVQVRCLAVFDVYFGNISIYHFFSFNLYLIWFVVWFQQPPFVYKNAAGEWEGYCIDLLKSLQTLIDFEYELYEAPDKEYGRINDDMEWNGAVKEIIDEVQHVDNILVAIDNTLDKYTTMIKFIH